MTWALALAACGGSEGVVPSSEVVPPTIQQAEPVTADQPVPAPRKAEPVPLGDFRMTFYFVIGEDEVAEPARVAASGAAGHRTPRVMNAIGGARDGRDAGIADDASVAVVEHVPPPDELAIAPASPEEAIEAKPRARGGLPAPPVGREAESLVGSLASQSDGAGSATGDAGDAARESASLAQAVPDQVTIYDRRCNVLAQVTPRYAVQLDIQGTGKLRDGRVINVAGPCTCARTPCYWEIVRSRWGYAGTGHPLAPFRTVAVDPRRVKLGSLLYIPELDGLTMPGRAPWGGFVHDGCVVAHDTGGGVQGKQLDLFVGRRASYRALARRGSYAWSSRVTVYDGSTRCRFSRGKASRSQRGAI